MYTDFFLATDEALRQTFVGWGEPLDAPPEDGPALDLSTLERAEMKSVDSLRLAQLLVAVRGETLSDAVTECSRPALVAPVSANGSLLLVRLPERLVQVLTTPAGEHDAIARAWEAEVLRDLASIPNESVRAFEMQRWTGACARILETLAALLAHRGPGESLHLLVTV
jgi:hypothetical protein